MLETHALPTVDTFSWTAAGEPWQAHSWGFDLILALFYNLAGLPAVALFCAALAALAAAVLLLLMPLWAGHRRWGRSRSAVRTQLMTGGRLPIGVCEPVSSGAPDLATPR